MSDRSDVPALGFHSLARFYDPLIAISMREETLKGRLAEQATSIPSILKGIDPSAGCSSVEWLGDCSPAT